MSVYKIKRDEWSLLQKWEHISFQAKEEPHFCKLTFFTHCRFHSLILDIGRPSFQVVNTTHEVSFSSYSSISSHLNLHNNTRYTRQGLVTYTKWITFYPKFSLILLLKQEINFVKVVLKTIEYHCARKIKITIVKGFTRI